MRIRNIHLKNFRQFYGEQDIALSTDLTKNVTLIHAENGVGKTTLLNSILWTFFGVTTTKFEQRDRIVNFEAEKEGKTSASVQVLFAHEDFDYLATRSFRNTDGRHSFSVAKFGANGALEVSLSNPDAFINSVMPAAMAPYFFFDGEQAETFSGEKNRKAVAGAIRDILGSTLIETAIEDLNYLARKFNEEIGEASGDTQIAAIEKEITDLEGKRDLRNEFISQLEADIDSISGQLGAISTQLSQAQAAAQLQRERLDKERMKKTVGDQLIETQLDILRWISSKSLASVSEKLTSQSLDFIDEESLRGRIPSPYNEDFVKGLLDAHQCVCVIDL